MNDQFDRELTELFPRDSDELMDEAFVQRCTASFYRAERRMRALKLIIVCTVASLVALALPQLVDLAISISSSIAAPLASIVPDSVVTVTSSFNDAVGGFDRAVAIGIALALVAMRYRIPSFRRREPRF